MLNQNVTHYFPWDDADETACGRAMHAADWHSERPTCAACAAAPAALAAEDALDAAIAETPLPLDADEARTELDPVLNAGAPALSPAMLPAGAALFDLARVLTACYTLTLDTDRRIA
jgi:hypothetical protein